MVVVEVSGIVVVVFGLQSFKSMNLGPKYCLQLTSPA